MPLKFPTTNSLSVILRILQWQRMASSRSISSSPTSKNENESNLVSSPSNYYKGYRHDVRERRRRCVLLTTSFAILVLLHRVQIFQKNHSFIVTTENYTKKDALVNSISFNDIHLVTGEIEASESDGEPSEQSKQQKGNSEQIDDDNLKPANVPIYINEISGGEVYAIDYRYLTSMWDRDTTYEHILEHAQQSTPYYNNTTTTTTAQTSLQHALMNNNNNITIMFHTVPKTASSTIRKSCLEVQHDVCNLPRQQGMGKWPDGYRTPKRLTQLFDICPTTFHFCVKGPIPITKNYTQFYDTRTFLHLFPFRNYNEWTRSALHQIAFRDVRDGTTECDETVELLNECLPHKYELDFEKYTKSVLAMWMKSYNHAVRMNGDVVEQHHTILLYNYLHLDETLNWLSDAYGAPQIEGTDRKINSVRPDESCPDEEEMLKKFHNCFSDELAGLH